MKQHPIFYSLQHCPYAIRARLALLLAHQEVLIRAIDLRDKPEEMLKISPTGTVPLLIVDENLVIDESLEIMLWALSNNDPENLLLGSESNALAMMLSMISDFDNEFKGCLEKYKSAKRFHEPNVIHLRQQCESFIAEIVLRLQSNEFFMGNSASLVDYAIFPYIRQFAQVERHYYLQSTYYNVRKWLNNNLQSSLFSRAMVKYPLWQETHESYLLALHRA